MQLADYNNDWSRPLQTQEPTVRTIGPGAQSNWHGPRGETWVPYPTIGLAVVVGVMVGVIVGVADGCVGVAVGSATWISTHSG